MYLDFYGLKEEPFNLTPDSHFLFLSEQHRKALSYLKYGVEHKKGFIALTGEVGSGKTTVCRAFLKLLEKEKYSTALVLNSFLGPEELLKVIIDDFDVFRKINVKENPEGKGKEYYIEVLNRFLLEETNKGKICVLIIDECQNLSFEVLEQIRMLSNLETEKEKLLQIVLIGQPEFLEKLSSYELRQLNQRITVRSHLYPLSKDDCREYIYHRLEVAGDKGMIEFTDGAVNLIYKYCKGIPRNINVICDYSLIVGYVKETRKITKHIVKEAIAEIEIKRPAKYKEKAKQEKKGRGKSFANVLLVILIIINVFLWSLFFRKNMSPKIIEKKKVYNKAVKTVYVRKVDEKNNQQGANNGVDKKNEEKISIDVKGRVSIDDIPDGFSSAQIKDKTVEDNKEENIKIDNISAAVSETKTYAENFLHKEERNSKGVVSDKNLNQEVEKVKKKREDIFDENSDKKIEKQEEVGKKSKNKTVSEFIKETSRKEEAQDVFLNEKDKAILTILWHWGVNRDEVKGDIESFLKENNFIVADTWASLDYLLALNLPFGIKTKDDFYLIVYMYSKGYFYAHSDISGDVFTYTGDELKNLWKGSAVILCRQNLLKLDISKTYCIGDKGEDIINLKKMLKYSGYLEDVINDVFDKNTEAAVKNLQKAYFLYPDGIVGVETIFVLYSITDRDAPHLTSFY